MILEACSQMPPTLVLMKPLRRVAQPAGHLLGAFHSIIAIRNTSLYLMTSAAVSWASTVCFMLLLFRQGRHVCASFLSESWLTGSLPALCASADHAKEGKDWDSKVRGRTNMQTHRRT